MAVLIADSDAFELPVLHIQQLLRRRFQKIIQPSGQLSNGEHKYFMMKLLCLKNTTVYK